jgi:hypothetical protein
VTGTSRSRRVIAGKMGQTSQGAVYGVRRLTSDDASDDTARIRDDSGPHGRASSPLSSPTFPHSASQTRPQGRADDDSDDLIRGLSIFWTQEEERREKVRDGTPREVGTASSLSSPDADGWVEVA